MFLLKLQQFVFLYYNFGCHCCWKGHEMFLFYMFPKVCHYFSTFSKLPWRTEISVSSNVVSAVDFSFFFPCTEKIFESTIDRIDVILTKMIFHNGFWSKWSAFTEFQFIFVSVFLKYCIRSHRIIALSVWTMKREHCHFISMVSVKWLNL